MFVYGRTRRDQLKNLERGDGRIFIGAITGDISLIRLVINEGGWINSVLEPFFGEMVLKLGKAYVDFPSCPPLHLAFNFAKNENLNAAMFLLKQGADVNQFQLPSSNFDPMRRGYPPALLFSLGLGQTPNNHHALFLRKIYESAPEKFNSTAMKSWILQSGNPPILQMTVSLNNFAGSYILVSHLNHSVHDVDQWGMTGLHLAAWYGDVATLAMLIDYSADPLAVDYWRRNALQIGILQGQLDVVHFFMNSTVLGKDNSTDVNSIREQLLTSTDKYGLNSLQLALRPPAIMSVVSALLEYYETLNITFAYNDSISKIRKTMKDDPSEKEDASYLGPSGWDKSPIPTTVLTPSLANVPHMSEVDLKLVLAIDKLSASAVSSTRFRKKYLSSQRPLLITNQLMVGQNIWAHMDRTNFLQRYGMLNVTLADELFIDKNQKTSKLSVSDYIGRFMKENRSYQTSVSNTGELSSNTIEDTIETGTATPSWPVVTVEASRQSYEDWRQDFSTPHIFQQCGPKDNEPFHLYLSPRGTGLPLHSHNQSWNLLLVGKKKWVFLTPGPALNDTDPLFGDLTSAGGAEQSEQDYGNSGRNVFQTSKISNFSAIPPLKWLQSMEAEQWRKKGRLLEIEQNAGDVLYIPHFWAHATISITDSVSVSQEFCTFLHTDHRVQPLGYVVYGGDDMHRGLGMFKTHLRSNDRPGLKGKLDKHRPVFDYPKPH